MEGITKSYYKKGMLKRVTVLYVRDMKQPDPRKSLPENGKLHEKIVYQNGTPAEPSKRK